MSEIIESGGGGSHGKHQKKRAKKHSSRVDMTPMVDLGFLLLTFFVLTTQFSKPKTMEINMPVIPKDTTKRMKIEDETALTLLLTDKKEKIYYYYGKFKPDASIIKNTDYSKEGVRKVFRDRNKEVIDQVKQLKDKLVKHQIADTTYKRMSMSIKGDKKAVFVIVKADDKAKYKSIIDVIDELNVADIGKYALVDISPAEKEMLRVMGVIK
ncbi:MAG: biopolymer transporter ExbD [Bacteroidetes bacterium]|nr:biopolymer transporter ExbD [Bacteroidota bacterium]